jgi:hypothetical protein
MGEVVKRQGRKKHNKKKKKKRKYGGERNEREKVEYFLIYLK